MLIIVSCFLVIFGSKAVLQICRSRTVPDAIPARAKGNPQAKLKIVEYIDFECPACAQGTRLLRDYLAKYPNQIYLEVKYFPLPMHQHGMPSARFAECAARQNKFWPFVELLMERQSSWASLHDPQPAFRQIAGQAGVNSSKLDACLSDKYLDETILTEKTVGTTLGIRSTPTYFVNEKMFVGTRLLQEQLTAFFAPADLPDRQTGLPGRQTGLIDRQVGSSGGGVSPKPQR